MSGRGRVCFFAPYLYPVMSGGRIPFAGGSEIQQAALSRGLAARGFDVSAVTCDYGQPARVVVDGVALLRAYPPYAGLPVLRFFHPRLSRSVSALWRADADVYCVRGAGLGAGIAYEVARLRGARSLFMTAHDDDALRAVPLLPNPRDRWWYRRALRGADAVLVQTREQRATLEREFAIAGEVVPNPVTVPAAAVDPGRNGTIVWIATYKPWKRPEWFVALARRLPEHRFVMAGVVPEPGIEQGTFGAAQDAARELPNLEVHGFVDHARLSELFADAALFVHTSISEGFPNTVLEAWAQGVPSLTAVDPDGVVSGGGLGEVATTLEALEGATRRWMADPAARRAAGERALVYVRERHDPAAVGDRLAAIIDREVAARRRRRPAAGARGGR